MTTDSSTESSAGTNTASTSAAWAEDAIRRAGGSERPGPDRSEDAVLDRIEKVRRRRPRVREERITLAHGAGGKATATLIDAVFLEAFRNPELERLGDGAAITVGDARLAFSTDSYVVSPIFFPGGDIGDLAVNGTVNDLAMCGARPLYLSAGFVLEEGFPVADLQRVVASMARAAADAGVQIVTGDTKVVGRGKADGCFVTTAGVGLLDRALTLGADQARSGDVVLVSGPIGDHGVTILLERGELDIDADLTSDTAAMHTLAADLLDAGGGGVRVLRDATRGGVATVLNEIATASSIGVLVDEATIPVRDVVQGASELLGIDPLYVACEGRLVAVVAADVADATLAAMRANPLGVGAVAIGRVADDPPGLVLLHTAFGGTRIVDVLVGDPLPRIC